MAQDGIRDTWTPVKLTHVLETVTPGLAKQLNSFGPEMIAAISDDGRADPEAELQQLLGQRALTAYAERLADRNGHELAAADLRELDPSPRRTAPPSAPPRGGNERSARSPRSYTIGSIGPRTPKRRPNAAAPRYRSPA